jgi:hypothetical protein
VLSWAEFAHARPDLAEAGRRLLYQFGVGLGFLATVRAGGGPRLHPMCPLVTEDALVGFLQPSPKRQDLHRDGRYALHCFPPDDNEDAFVVSGRALLIQDPGRRQRATVQFLAERQLATTPPGFETQDLFEFYLGGGDRRRRSDRAGVGGRVGVGGRRRCHANYAGTWELPALGAVPAPTAVLIRPDGYVAWVGEGTQLGLADALTTWFGPPTAA